MLNITDKQVEEALPPIFRLGFRPFFLLGSVYAVLALGLWLWMFQKGPLPYLQVSPLWWHAHEMLFGFAMAIVIGFVLTAVQNWTGVPGTKGKRLGAIVALWLIARVAFWLPVSPWVSFGFETLLLLIVGIETGSRVIASKGWRNAFFVPLFALAIVANGAAYWALLEQTYFSSSQVWQSMLWWFTLLLSVMGGRVIPFFTALRCKFDKPAPIKALELLANLPLLLLFLCSFIEDVSALLTASLMFVSGIAQLIRMWRWKPMKALKEPLLWSLHLTYLFIPLGLILRSVIHDPFISHNLLHLFVVGGIGGVVLAMITRVTMGHTGRAIYEGPNMSIAFALLISSALVRGLGVGLFPAHMMDMITLSGALWMIAFALYIVKFSFMLLTKRADGHPG